MSKHKIHLLMFHILYTYNLDIILHSTLKVILPVGGGKSVYIELSHLWCPAGAQDFSGFRALWISDSLI